MEMYGMLGERLGPIGGVKQQAGEGTTDQHTPQWKKDALQKPSISIRRGIAWEYNAPYEDTDTVVLTSTKSGFVDIRFPRKRELGKPIASDPSFWAFSGVSSTSFLEGDEIKLPYSTHCIWKHDIDSKGPDITDEGDMFTLANGDCIEIGMMENPSSGKVEMYKEYWTSPKHAGPSQLTPCIVAKVVKMPSDHEDQEGIVPKGRGGVIIRIGGYCQGIMRQQQAGNDGHATPSDAILVERWTRGVVNASHSLNTTAPGEQPNTATSSGWVQDWRSNTPADTGVSIPCMWAFDDGRRLGDETVVKGITWKIVEALANKEGGDGT